LFTIRTLERLPAIGNKTSLDLIHPISKLIYFDPAENRHCGVHNRDLGSVNAALGGGWSERRARMGWSR
jgi:hypothetical protein